MNRSSVLKVVLALSTSAVLASCSATRNDNLLTAASAAGEASAASIAIDIGALPDECYRDTPHAPLVEGRELIGILKRERGQTDLANTSRRNCVAVHDDKRERLLNRGAVE